MTSTLPYHAPEVRLVKVMVPVAPHPMLLRMVPLARFV